MNTSEVFVGIDVSKAALDVGVLPLATAAVGAWLHR